MFSQVHIVDHIGWVFTQVIYWAGLHNKYAGAAIGLEVHNECGLLGEMASGGIQIVGAAESSQDID